MSEFYQKIVMSPMCEGCKFAKLKLSGCDTIDGFKWYLDCMNQFLCEEVARRSRVESLEGLCEKKGVTNG